MAYPLSPTAVLPALVTLYACNAARIGEALGALQDVYFPHGTLPALKQSVSEAVQALRPKRTACLAHQEGVPDSGYASAEEDDQGSETEQEDMVKDAIDSNAIEMEDEELDNLRSDEFERGYAIKWLTGLVKRGDAWVCGPDSSSLSPEEQEMRTNCLENASRLLARFAGDDTPEEALTRMFVFPFCMLPCLRCHFWDVSSPPPITVELNDAPVDGTDHTAVGLQSWGSAIVFAERLCSNPERYLGTLHPCTFIPTATATRRRILELGAGTGLLSITAAQIFSRTPEQAKIKATDYHPSVLENLARNVLHNQSAEGVSVEKFDWCTVQAGVDGEEDEGGIGLYDVVLAADVVYHPEHASWIRGCVERTLKKGGVFWLIIPVRTVGRHAGLGETVEEAFPVWSGVGGGGEHLAVVCREKVARVEGVGRADEGGYTLFEIRWAVDQ